MNSRNTFLIYTRTNCRSKKQKLQTNGTVFLDLNIKVIRIDVYTSFYDKRDDFEFPIANYPWLRNDVPKLPSYGENMSHLVGFARCYTSVFDFHSKNLQISSNLNYEKKNWKVLQVILWSLIQCWQNNVSRIYIFLWKCLTPSYTVIYSTNLRRVEMAAIYVSSGSKIVENPSTSKVWPSDHREDYRSCVRPFYSLVQIFPTTNALWHIKRWGLHNGTHPTLLRGD